MKLRKCICAGVICMICQVCCFATDTVLVQVLTLDQCRQMALNNTVSSQLSQESKAAAELNRKAALAAMFPTISANGSYMWNSRHMVLLADQSEFSFGTASVANGTPTFTWSADSKIGQMLEATKNLPVIHSAVTELSTTTGQMIADVYQELYNRLDLDMTHVVVGQVGITQPIYVGGRLRELYNISKATEQLVGLRSDDKRDQTIVNVDEAYWRVVDVEHKQRLAHQYYDLIVQLESDVQSAIAEGLATQSDLLKVTAKKGEAQVQKLQADNGLILSKMALCQLIGVDLSSTIQVSDKGIEELPLHDTVSDMQTVVNNRREIQMLEQAAKIAKSNQRIMAAGLQPNIVASANYIYTNPNVENGFSTNWKGKGFFSAGVVVNIPIAHADDILRYKASKHEAKVAELKIEETRELLSLQITQAKQRVLEADQKVVMTQLALKNSEQVLYMAQESFKAGLVTSSDVMQAQTAWLKAATDKVDADIEAKMTDTYLRRYTGTLEY